MRFDLRAKSSSLCVSLLRRRTERGATLVEYAFVLLLFLSLLFGVSGFGHLLYVYHAINNAAKEGSRWASVNGHLCSQDSSCNGTNGMNSGEASITDIQNYAGARLPASVQSSLATITAAFSAPAGSPDVCTKTVKDTGGNNYGPFSNYPGCVVAVTVSYPYTFHFPLLPTATTTTAPCGSPGWCLSVTSKMVIAH